MFWSISRGNTGTETLTIEDWSDNTLADFEVAQAPWQVDATSKLDGEHSAYHPDGTSSADLIDTANHTQIERGDTLEWDWVETTNGAGGVRFLFGLGAANKSTEHYVLYMDFKNDVVKFQTNDGAGNNNTVHTATFAHVTGDRYHVTINDTDGSLTNPTFDVSIDNVTAGTTPVSFSWSDSGNFWGGGGFGWHGIFGAEVYLDTLLATRSTATNTTKAYFTGNTYYNSVEGSIQAAVNAAGKQDVVVVDANETVTTHIDLKNDIKVEGGGGTISIHEDAKAAFGLYNSLTNVWLDGLTIVGPGQTPVTTGTYGIGGPGGRGPFTNFRVTNCDVSEVPNNGISFVTYGTDDATDVYIANNTVTNVGSHGILMGCGDTGGSNSNHNSNIVCEGNTVDGVDQAQAIGVFGHSGGVSSDILVIDNTVGRQTQTDRGATFMSMEEDVNHCAFISNEIKSVNKGTNCAVTKRAYNNLIANNYSHSGPSGMNTNNYGYYLPDGPPVKNIYAHNHVDNCNKGVHYKNIDSPDNVFYHNRITNCSPELSLAAPALTGDSDMPRVWDTTTETSDTGLLGAIGTKITYYTGSGSVGAEVTWTTGGPHPDEPVNVTVATYPDRY